jgi:hypothetical protein
VISAVPAADDAGAGDLLLREQPDVLPRHRPGDLEQKLRQDIEELLAQAEKTDREGAADVRGEANLRDDQSRAGVAPVPPPKVDESLKVTVKAPA